MHIEEYADALNLELIILRYPNQANRYCAQFEDCEVKDDAGSAILESAYGNGSTPQAAIAAYLNEIRGKVLVVCAGDPERRRQYVVPRSLSCD